MVAPADPTDALRAFVAMLAEQLAPHLGTSDSMPWRPLSVIATSLEWAPRHLREFCEEHGVAIAGTRKAPLVDLPALKVAIASTARVRKSPARAHRDMKPANEISDDDILAANGARRKAVR